MPVNPKPQPKVTLRIEQGTVSPAQKKSWDLFWKYLFTEAQSTKEKPGVDESPGQEGDHSQDD